MKVCAVCGTEFEQGRVWERTQDGKRFNVCFACAEVEGKVNECSVDNHAEGERVGEDKLGNMVSYWKRNSSLGAVKRARGRIARV